MSETVHQQPPQWPIKLLRQALNSDYLEEIEGDMEEIFLDNLKLYSEKKARRFYIKESLKLIRPQLFRHFEGRQQLNFYGMFKNNLKIAIRVFQRDKVYSLINVFGMATGLAIALLILLYAQFEMSYESYNPNADRVVRITMDYLDGETLIDQDSETYPPLGPKIKEEFAEVEDFARAYGLDEVTLNINEKNFRGSKIYAADPSFFEMFNYPFIQGTSEGIFQDPMEAVLTESLAMKMFGTTDIVGERMLIPDMGQNLNVVGVIPDSPANTHFKFNIRISFETMRAFEEDIDNNWSGNNAFTYLMLNSADQYGAFESNLLGLNDQLHDLEIILSELVIGQRRQDIHLYSDKSFEPEQNGDATRIFFLTGVALLVIAIAIVNYINVSTAKAMDRAKEVGVRKVMGSTISQRRFQFFTESLLVNLLAGSLAVLMMIISFGIFRQTAALPESFSFLDKSDFWILLTGILAVSTIVSTELNVTFALANVLYRQHLKSICWGVNQGKPSLIKQVLILKDAPSEHPSSFSQCYGNT
jgi:putative ABC transport system permease protein